MLLVEDDPSSARALARLLGFKGYEVTSADTVAGGGAALAGGPHILILDLMLPDGDGATLLRRVRAETPEVWVAVVTAVTDPARLRAVRGLNPDCLMSKPLDLPALLDAMRPPASN